jgi:hypothetical protein
MLGFVGEVGTPIFHLGDLRIGIPRMLPVLVGGLLLALAVQARQVLAGGSLDPRGLRETGQELLITLRSIAAHDAAHRRVGLQRGAAGVEVECPVKMIRRDGFDRSVLTVLLETPVSCATERTLQWVACLGRLRSTRLINAATCSSPY